MVKRIIWRKAHPRRNPSGRTTIVNHTSYECKLGEKPEKKTYQKPCRFCGAMIIRVPMKRGGWVNFEAAPGLTRVKHPCMHRGEGLSRKRDQETIDMFYYFGIGEGGEVISADDTNSKRPNGKR